MSRLFVSDVHLDAGAPEAVEQFLEFLKTHAADAESLYILGDLFETWIGDDDPDPAKARVCAGIRDLTASGTGCFVLHGNRDFLIGRDFCHNTGSRLLADPIVIDLNGERVLLTHGDALCTDDHSYQELRSIVRTPEWQRRFLSLPVTDREMLANQARAGSRQHTKRTIPNIMDVIQDTPIAPPSMTRTSKASRRSASSWVPGTKREAISPTTTDSTTCAAYLADKPSWCIEERPQLEDAGGGPPCPPGPPRSAMSAWNFCNWAGLSTGVSFASVSCCICSCIAFICAGVGFVPEACSCSRAACIF
jgi:UDP-2,3-diacylglucosamine hydrolase